MIPYFSQDIRDIIPKHLKANSGKSDDKIKCQICGEFVYLKDYRTSFRLQDDGSYFVVNLCQKCRDSGK